MKLFFKIFNEWVLFLTGFFMLTGFLNNLIVSNTIPKYFGIVFAISLISGIISTIVWGVKIILFLLTDTSYEFFK